MSKIQQTRDGSGLTDLFSMQPISISILRDIRLHLIQNARPLTKVPEITAVYDSFNEELEDQRIHTYIFDSVLATSLLPALSNQHRTVAIDVLSIWITRGISIMDDSVTERNPLLAPFCVSHKRTLGLFKELASLLITYFEDASSALSKALKDLFSTTLNSYSIVLSFSPETKNDTEVDFIHWLLNLSISSLSHYARKKGNNGKLKVVYFILEALVKAKPGKGGVRAKDILQLYDDQSGGNIREEKEGSPLIRFILSNASRDRGTAPAIGKAAIAILSVRKVELLQGSNIEGGIASWMNLWTKPLQDLLAGPFSESDGFDHAAGRKNLVTYVLPGLFRAAGPVGFKKFVSGFGVPPPTPSEVMKTPRIGCQDEAVVDAWIGCLRVGKEIGFVGDVGDAIDSKENFISPALLTHLLIYPAASIRLSALTLLTSTTITTKPMPKTSLKLLKSYLPFFHSSNDPEFRNHVCGLIRALIERLAGSSFACTREARKLQQKLAKTKVSPGDGGLIEQTIKKLHSQVENTEDFVKWYISFLQEQMYPGKGFPRISMGMRILRIWIMSGVGVSPSEKSTGKELAANSRNRKARTGPQGSEMQFPFTTQIFTSDMARVLLDNLFHPFEDIRAGSAEILKIGLLSSDDAWSISVISSAFVARCFRIMRNSGRARDADGLARVLEIIYDIVRRIEKHGKGELLLKVFPEDKKEVALSGPIEVLEWLVEDILEGKFLAQVRKGGVKEGVRGWPVHGILAGLRLIFERGNIYDDIIGEDNHHRWRGLHRRIISKCHDIWVMNRPVLCDAAPEGYLPIDFVNGAKSDMDSDDDDDEDENFDMSVTTQTLMSYSWRAIKESSALLGVILYRAPYQPEINAKTMKQDKNMLIKADFEEGGNILLDELANIRHRGAFSAVSPSFFQLCKRCFESSDQEIHALPRKWLIENLSLISSKASVITRRSAGIPFLIVGILTAESDLKRPLLTETFNRFKEIAKLPTSTTLKGVDGKQESGKQGSDGRKVDLPQVHALNCIKFMFTDSRLGQFVTHLVGEGLELAVGCFGSSTWAIRNCGIMLFSTLINRLFGTSNSRNDYAYTASTYSTQKFFQKYPAVRSILLSHLGAGVKGIWHAVQSVESPAPLVEMVYPALTLISRLDVSPEYSMKEFQPLVLQCMASRIWKIREAAAEAYVTLVAPTNFLHELEHLLKVGVTKQNKLHGNLCAVKALLVRRLGGVLEEQEPSERENTHRSISRLLEEGIRRHALRNKCPVIRSMYFEIVELVAFNIAATQSLRSFLSTLVTATTIPARVMSGPQRAGNHALRKTIARIFARLIITDPARTCTIAKDMTLLFERHDDEVMVTIAEILKESKWNNFIQSADAIELEELLFKYAIMEEGWSQLRVAAMELLDRFFVIDGVDRKLTYFQAVENADKLLTLIERSKIHPLKEAGLRVAGKLICRIWQASNISLDLRQQYTTRWLKIITTASHENMPYMSRKAALDSLAGLSSILDISQAPRWAPSHDCLIPALFHLYDFLNDDDESIRIATSGIVCRNVLHTSSPMIPMATSENLMKTLSQRLGNRSNFTEILIGKLVGLDAIEKILKSAEMEESVLFIEERQNLFVDDLRETNLVKDALIECTSHSPPSLEPTQRLLNFVLEGIEAVTEYAIKVEQCEAVISGTVDGPLGWTSISEGVFALGFRLFSSFEVIGTWWREFGEIVIGAKDWEHISNSINKFDGRAGKWEIHAGWVKRHVR